MRIIGGKDYYDGAAAYGIDPGIVFVRKEFRLTNGDMDTLGRYVTGNFFLRPDTEEDLNYRDRYSYEQGNLGPNLKVKVFNPILIFCGKVYSGMFVEITEGHYPHEIRTEHRFWNLEKFESFIKDHGWRMVGTYGNQDRGTILLDDMFAVKDVSSEALQILIEKQIVNVVPKERPLLRREYLYRGRAGWMDQDSDYVANTDTLKDWDFQKAVDPVSAFQQISQWVGGALASHGPQMVQITDDKIKIAKHGFDTKTSFRKSKESK